MCVCVCCVLVTQSQSDSTIPWTVAHQAPLSMEFSRQEYWSALPCPPPGDLSNLGIEPMSFISPALAGGFFTTSSVCEALKSFFALLTAISSLSWTLNSKASSGTFACFRIGSTLCGLVCQAPQSSSLSRFLHRQPCTSQLPAG